MSQVNSILPVALGFIQPCVAITGQRPTAPSVDMHNQGIDRAWLPAKARFGPPDEVTRWIGQVETFSGQYASSPGARCWNGNSYSEWYMASVCVKGGALLVAARCPIGNPAVCPNTPVLPYPAIEAGDFH